MENQFIAIAACELDAVTGGASPTSWDAYVKSQRNSVAGAYKNVVCTTAGVKGGREFATQVYGKDRTTGGDMVRAAETLKSVCIGGSRLPVQAPPTPF